MKNNNNISFYGYNDGKAITIYNAINLFIPMMVSLGIAIILSIFSYVFSSYYYLIGWIIPFIFFLAYLLILVTTKYNDEVFLKGLRKKHSFLFENNTLYKDGKEIKSKEMKLYIFKKFLFLELKKSYYRIPNEDFINITRYDFLSQVQFKKFTHKIKFIERYQCDCCGYYTLTEKGVYDICPVCFWEDTDGFNDPDEYDECNRMTLNEARKNYHMFGACKKECKKHTRKPKKYEMYKSPLINEYLNFINHYTNINLSKDNFNKEIKNNLKGSFNNLCDCVTYLYNNSEYAIRFNDDMNPEEFKNIFEFLFNELGEPDKFSEWEGYVWKRRDYVITFGLVALNYAYEVPMISFKRKINPLWGSIVFSEYRDIAKLMNEPFLKRGINPQKSSYYLISYFKEFGYSLDFYDSNIDIYINYKKSKLSISITVMVRNQIIDPKKIGRIYKEVYVKDKIDLNNKIEQLLLETKEHHNL